MLGVKLQITENILLTKISSALAQLVYVDTFGVIFPFFPLDLPAVIPKTKVAQQTKEDEITNLKTFVF